MRKLSPILLLVLLLVWMLAVPTMAAPSPSREEAEVIASLDDMPDANDPDAPDFIVIQDEDTALADAPLYVRVQDDDGKWEYILEDDIPMAEVPEDTSSSNSNTGSVSVDSPKTNRVAGLVVGGVMVCGGGISLLALLKRRI